MYKTKSRTITTLQGDFVFRVKHLRCPRHKHESISSSSALNNLAPSGRKYSIDIVMAVGILRWGLCLQRDQVKGYLQRRGIKIPTGMISYLSIDFLLLVEQIHQSGKGLLEKWFHKHGGMIIHVDATDEKGGNALFQIKESRTGITLYSESLISERSEYITPILRDFKKHYGNPLTIVRDMGSAIISSCEEVFPKVLNQICHYHFITALGKRIYKDIFDDLRTEIISTKIIDELRYLRKSVRVRLKESSVLLFERHELYWLHMVIDHLLYPLRNPIDYPFRLNYLEFYERVKNVYSQISSGETHNNISTLKISQYNNIIGQLDRLLRKSKIQTLVEILITLQGWYTQIRKTMRLMRKDLRENREFSHQEIEEMKRELSIQIDNIVKDGAKKGGILQRRSKLIRDNFDMRWNELFIELRDADGNFIPLRRDNNIDEQAHRSIRMGFRRRTGRSRTQNELYQLGPLIAYFSNLFNEQYRKIVLNDNEPIMSRLSEQDWSILPFERRKLFLFSDGVAIPLGDEKRNELITEFMKNNSEYPNDEYLKDWLNKMNGLICSWEMEFVDTDIKFNEIYSTRF